MHLAAQRLSSPGGAAHSLGAALLLEESAGGRGSPRRSGGEVTRTQTRKEVVGPAVS